MTGDKAQPPKITPPTPPAPATPLYPPTPSLPTVMPCLEISTRNRQKPNKYLRYGLFRLPTSPVSPDGTLLLGDDCPHPLVYPHPTECSCRQYGALCYGDDRMCCYGDRLGSGALVLRCKGGIISTPCV